MKNTVHYLKLFKNLVLRAYIIRFAFFTKWGQQQEQQDIKEGYKTLLPGTRTSLDEIETNKING